MPIETLHAIQATYFIKSYSSLSYIAGFDWFNA